MSDSDSDKDEYKSVGGDMDSDREDDMDSEREDDTSDNLDNDMEDSLANGIDIAADGSTSVACSREFNNIKVSVVKEEITNQKVDVIVNSTARSLDLNQGAASRALLAKAGQTIQQECTNNFPNGISDGEIAVTNGGNLQCKHVYHVCLPKWNGAVTKTFLDKLIYKCLRKASDASLISIAFPALGTGNLGYDKDQVAKSMFECVKKFQMRHTDTSLKDVRCVIFPADQASLQAFVSYCQEDVVDTSARTVHTAAVKNMTVNLVVGKLADQQCDVIMTSCTRGLDLKRGTLSKSVLDAGGPSIQAECATKYLNGIQHGEIAVLGPGNLPCKHVYCGSLPRHDKPPADTSETPEQLLTKLVKCCLQQATTDKMTSICFPTLGTGYLMYPAKVAASTILKAICDFSARTPNSSVKTVHIAIFDTISSIQKNKQTFVKECDKYKSSRPISAPSHRPVLRPVTEPKPVPAPRPVSAFSRTNYRSLFGLSPTIALDDGAVDGASACPRRQTPEFCMYKYGQTDIYPPSYWTVYTNNKTVKQWKVEQKGKPSYTLVNVDQSMFKMVEKLVADTWEPAKVGHGRDAEGLGDVGYTQLKVTKVQRVENLTLYESYIQKQQMLFHKAGEGSMFKKLSQLPGVKHGDSSTEKYLDPTMKNLLYEEVNEVCLFHGTKPDKVEALLTQGIDPRLGQGEAVFGKGIYMAESSTKADQYADDRKQARGKPNLKMFLVSSSLGQICLMNNVKKFRRPPCLHNCDQDDCSHTDRYDSIVSEGKFIFREFVVYETSQVYPEYVITYNRV